MAEQIRNALQPANFACAERKDAQDRICSMTEARVAELADAPDLGSGPVSGWRFDPSRAHHHGRTKSAGGARGARLLITIT